MMFMKVVMGLISMAFAITFFAVPILKLKEVALTIVVLIGVAMMVYEFIENVREKDDRSV